MVSLDLKNEQMKFSAGDQATKIGRSMTQISNKTLKILFALTLLLQITGLFIYNSDHFPVIAILAALINVFWLFLIYSYATIRHTVYFRIMMVLLATLLIGVLFKLQHWEGGSPILMGSTSGLMITYFIRFIKKKQKRLLDILKVAWAEVTLGTSLGVLQHWIPKEYSLVGSLLFIFMIGAFCLTPVKKIGMER